MTTHELAKLLRKGPDLLVVAPILDSFYFGGIGAARFGPIDLSATGGPAAAVLITGFSEPRPNPETPEVR